MKYIAGINCKGFSFYKRSNLWYGEIMIDGRKIRKGFKTIEEALEFRKRYENIKYDI